VFLTTDSRILDQANGFKIEIVGGFVKEENVGRNERTRSNCSRRRSPPESSFAFVIVRPVNRMLHETHVCG